MSEVTRAKPSEVKAFFEAGGGKVSAAEIMKLKKNPDGTESIDYQQVADGIGDGSLDYTPTKEQVAAARAITHAVPSGLNYRVAA